MISLTTFCDLQTIELAATTIHYYCARLSGWWMPFLALNNSPSLPRTLSHRSWLERYKDIHGSYTWAELVGAGDLRKACWPWPYTIHLQICDCVRKGEGRQMRIWRTMNMDKTEKQIERLKVMSKRAGHVWPWPLLVISAGMWSAALPGVDTDHCIYEND